jgi:hypothetical protein
MTLHLEYGDINSSPFSLSFHQTLCRLMAAGEGQEQEEELMAASSSRAGAAASAPCRAARRRRSRGEAPSFARRGSLKPLRILKPLCVRILLKGCAFSSSKLCGVVCLFFFILGMMQHAGCGVARWCE